MRGRLPLERLHGWIVGLHPRRFRSRFGSDARRLYRDWVGAGSSRSERRLRAVKAVREAIRTLVAEWARTMTGRPGGDDASRPIGRWERSKGIGGVWILRTDLRYALRALRGSPLFTSVATLTLALGIGAVVALFSVVEGVLIRPLPYPDADRLVRVERVSEPGVSGSVGWADYVDWDQAAPGFDGMAASVESVATFEWEGGAEAVQGARVTHDFFQVVGVSPALGRSFSRAEDSMDGPRAVILSHGMWMRSFGGAPDVLGRTVPLEGEAVPIVGVMPPEFAFPYDAVEYWTPLREEELFRELGLPLGTRTLGFLDVLGRLESGAELAVVRANLSTLAGRIDREAGKSDRVGEVTLTRLRDAMAGDVRATLVFLFAAGILVMLVACANVAGLSLGRAAARDRELAVRTAVGADRWRLLRQLLTESAVLGFVSGGLGLVVAWALTRGLVRLGPDLPRSSELGFGMPAVAFGLGVLLVSVFLFGLIPALRVSRRGRAAVAGVAKGSATLPGLRLQRVLVSSQVAVSVVLLVGAALLANSYSRLLSAERGFDTQSVVVASIQPSEGRYPTPAEIDAFYEDLLTQVRRLPFVRSATTTNAPPLMDNGFYTAVVGEGKEETDENREWLGTVIVRDDYFATSGVPLMAGRAFDARDRLGEPLVAIVSRSAADRLWPGEDPLGKKFRFAGGIRGSADNFNRAFFPKEDMTVVGVAGDVRRTGLADGPEEEYYRPHAQLTWGFQYLVVRTAGGFSGVAESLRETVWSLDATIPVRTIQTVESTVSESVAEPRFRMQLLVAFALTACLLAMVGLYAVTTLAVGRRTREMGIRMALGASRTGLLGAVLGGGLRLVVWGLAAGILLAWWASRSLASMLFEVGSHGPGDLPRGVSRRHAGGRPGVLRARTAREPGRSDDVAQAGVTIGSRGQGPTPDGATLNAAASAAVHGRSKMRSSSTAP